MQFITIFTNFSRSLDKFRRHLPWRENLQQWKSWAIFRLHQLLSEDHWSPWVIYYSLRKTA